MHNSSIWWQKNNKFFHKYPIFFSKKFKKWLCVYNRGVDKMNQNLLYYKCQRNVHKYWKKLFFFGWKVAISKSKILFELTHNEKKETDLEYKAVLVKELLDALNDDEMTEKNESYYIPPFYVNKIQNIWKKTISM